MALLGQYYAHKIQGATELALYRAAAGEAAAGEPPVAHQQRAVQALTEAAKSWRQYTTQAAAQYRNPVWTNRVGHVDWAQLTREVDQDVAIARQPAQARPRP
jgi:hypothetical protein